MTSVVDLKKKSSESGRASALFVFCAFVRRDYLTKNVQYENLYILCLSMHKANIFYFTHAFSCVGCFRSSCVWDSNKGQQLFLL